MDPDVWAEILWFWRVQQRRGTKMKQETIRSQWEELCAAFTLSDVSLRVVATTKDKTRGMIAPYVSARTIMSRLDVVVGIERWKDQYEAVGSSGGSVFVKCSLTIDSISKEDIGSGSDYKSACSDSLKRAAVKFGIGRYLYDVDKPWVRLDERGGILNEEAVKERMIGPPFLKTAKPNGATVLDGGSLRR